MRRRAIIVACAALVLLGAGWLTLHWVRRPMFSNRFWYGRDRLPDWDRADVIGDWQGVWGFVDLRLNTVLLNEVGPEISGTVGIMHNTYASASTGYGYTQSNPGYAGRVQVARQPDTLYLVASDGVLYTFGLRPEAAKEMYTARQQIDAGQLMLIDLMSEYINEDQKPTFAAVRDIIDLAPPPAP